MDKVYSTGSRGFRAVNRWLAGGSRFLGRSPVSPQRPRALKLGEETTVELRVGEVIEKRKAGAPEPRVRLRIQAKNVADAKHLALRLNDKPLSGATKSGDWFEFSVPPAIVRKGNNCIQIKLRSGGGPKSSVEDVLLRVRYSGGD